MHPWGVNYSHFIRVIGLNRKYVLNDTVRKQPSPIWQRWLLLKTIPSPQPDSLSSEMSLINKTWQVAGNMPWYTNVNATFTCHVYFATSDLRERIDRGYLLVACQTWKKLARAKPKWRGLLLYLCVGQFHGCSRNIFWGIGPTLNAIIALLIYFTH